jgi:plastocyanin
MRTRAVLAVASLALVLAACGSGGEATSTADTTSTTKAAAGVDLSKTTFDDETGSAKVEVDAVDNNFQAQYVEVKAGTTITFKNAGHNEHNLLPVTDGAFEGRQTDGFEPGTSFTVTFDKAGDYPYYCSLHGTTTKGMTGAVRVVE